MKLRKEEKKKLDSGTPIGEVLSVNLTKMEVSWVILHCNLFIV